MDKQEIEHKLEQTIKNRATICKGFTEEIGNLQEQLAEAEKPKLRHGDFGVEKCKECTYPRLITNPASVTGLTVSNEYGEIPPGNKITTVFGNIFDLLKEWSEDLEKFEVAGDCGVLNGAITSNNKDLWLKISSGSTVFTLEQIEEIWHKLGREIATLKRKQS